MPADALYWNSVDFDSDESVSNTFRREYVDPWDLENYAYIRDQLDSVEVSSEKSSFGEPVEASSFYYAPVKSKEYVFPTRQKYDTMLESESGTAKYVAIDDIYGTRETTGKKARQKMKQPKNDIYGIANFDLESDVDASYIYQSRNSATALYEAHRHRPATIRRRMSYSYGDYGYYNPYNSVYSRLEDNRRSASERPAPIYDDVGTRIKPNFGLSNYGHLQIDYSCSWNSLDKYIYN